MTRFSTGLLDSLFGEKIEIELPGPNGENVSRRVTKKWWDRMVAEGKVSRVDHLQKQAVKLVSSGKLLAVSLYQPLSERFPVASEIDPDDWDFFATIGGVFIAATRLRSIGLAEGREARLMEIVGRDLEEWDRNAATAFQDCKTMFEREFDRLTSVGHETRFVASDALGIWIVWNTLGRQPQTEQEVALVRGAGAVVTHSFFDWWTAE
jgi:hypothetical protein